MSGFYTSFSISPARESGKPERFGDLLTEVTEYLADDLGSDDAVSPLNVETDAIEGYGYASIDTERIHKRTDGTEELWRLAIRLYANEGGLWADVFTGIVGEDGENVSIRGGSPMFLRNLTERYRCRIGPRQIEQNHRDDVGEEFLGDPRRELPALLVSRGQNGNFPFGDLSSLSSRLLGIAQVIPVSSDRPFKDWGRPYGGFARIIWPGAKRNDGRGRYFSKGVTGGDRFISEVINAVVENSSQDIQDAFEREFVEARIACVQFRNEQLRSLVRDSSRSDESTQVKRLERRARKAEDKLERTQRDLENQRNVSQRTENRLETALADISRLEEELERASRKDGIAAERALSRNLGRQNEQMKKMVARKEATISNLNEELQRFRQRERAGLNGYDSILGDTSANPAQLTVIVHGLNVMRDPVRRYIMSKLSAKYGRDGIVRALQSCVNMDNPARWSKLTTAPESVIDINDFHNVVAAHPDCFGQERIYLSAKLREIKDVRNRTIHPDFESRAFKQRTETMINNIAGVLDSIGSSGESNQVRRLLNVL